ncbi:hypothetical protein BJ165DRAFT_1340354 [Panaeolus papilionaceus]|nr:hypothetical protein BJ165DRAFT_1340354 [Panaeolus papilionaceus]
MTVFYAYIHNYTHEDHCRIVMVFANRSVADEWWRAISESNLATHIRRINAQYYLHHYPDYNLLHFFVDEPFKPISDQFRGRLFMTLFDDRAGGPGNRYLPIIPNQDYTDHCSGNWCVRV